MELLEKSSIKGGEIKLNIQLKNGSEHDLLDPSRMQPEEDPSKTDEKPWALTIACINYAVSNTALKTLPQWAPVTTLVMAYLITSVAMAFLLSLVSLWLHPKKAAAILENVALALTGSTTAILWYYLLITHSVF